MKTQHETARSPCSRTRLCAALAVMLTLGPGALFAGQAPGVAEAAGETLPQVTTHHPGWDDPLVALKVERNSQVLIDVLRRADQSLAAEDGGTALARSNLDYASRIANGIEQEMPYVEITDRLMNARGRLAAGATQAFIEQLIPVYAAIDDLARVSPQMAGQFRQGVERAEAEAVMGQGAMAMERIDEVVDQVVITRAYLPVLYVKRQLDRAHQALSQQDTERARRSVERALGSLVTVSSGSLSGGKLSTFTAPAGQA